MVDLGEIIRIGKSVYALRNIISISYCFRRDIAQDEILTKNIDNAIDMFKNSGVEDERTFGENLDQFLTETSPEYNNRILGRVSRTVASGIPAIFEEKLRDD